jgi:peroxiredoxin
MLNAKAVNFTRGALDQAQIIIARQVQGNTVVVDAVGGFFAPACVSRLIRERNLHRFGHFIYPY